MRASTRLAVAAALILLGCEEGAPPDALDPAAPPPAASAPSAADTPEASGGAPELAEDPAIDPEDQPGEDPPPPVDMPAEEPDDPVAQPAEPVDEPAEEPIDEPAEETQPVAVELDPGEAVDLMPEPEEEPTPELPGRARKRMNLDQLDAAIRQASSGIGWTERRGANEVDLFVALSATLGKPDYIQVTTESLDPSALFQKFLDDAARSVCARALERDLATRARDPGVILHYVLAEDDLDSDPDAVHENLRYLIERFHGRHLPEEDVEATVAPWAWLFRTVVFMTGEPLDGWNVVCVGLFTHPDFYTY